MWRVDDLKEEDERWVPKHGEEAWQSSKSPIRVCAIHRKALISYIYDTLGRQRGTNLIKVFHADVGDFNCENIR